MVFPRLGPLEIGLIVLLVLIIFGVGKLPQVGSALGRSIREFRKGKEGLLEDEEEEEPDSRASVVKSSPRKRKASSKKA